MSRVAHLVFPPEGQIDALIARARQMEEEDKKLFVIGFWLGLVLGLLLGLRLGRVLGTFEGKALGTGLGNDDVGAWDEGGCFDGVTDGI